MQDRKYTQILIPLILFFLPLSHTISQVNPTSRIDDSPSSIIGFNHIGISVLNLEEMVQFYQKATGFVIVKREKMSNSKNADQLFGQKGMAYETVTLKAPNMLLELTQFSNQQEAETSKMPPQGPGMTHTCYQSPAWKSGYEKFKSADIEVLSRGDKPVDIGGYGVTYAYGYDPEGNMLEMEQLDKNVLMRDQVDSSWLQSNPMWMTQVALISPDLKQLVDFYRKVLAIAPYREGNYHNHPRLNDIIDTDSSSISASWFKMDGRAKMLELMQYVYPQTGSVGNNRHPTDLGYSFSFEVENIQEEYSRLKNLGIHFLSEPRILGEFWMVFANDVDGNVFSLRQPTSAHSIYSIKNMVAGNEE